MKKLEELKRKQEMRKHSAIEVVGENVAEPPKKKRIKRLGKYSIEFYKENEEKESKPCCPKCEDNDRVQLDEIDGVNEDGSPACVWHCKKCNTYFR